MRGRHVKRIRKKATLKPWQYGIGFFVVIILTFWGGKQLTDGIIALLPDDLVGEGVVEIAGIPLYTNFLSEDYAGRTGVTRRIKYLVIHETGNTAKGTDAQMHDRYLHSPEQKDVPLSWHYTVDDHQIYHHLPDDERGYHASDSSVKGGGNDCGIGIEICVNEDGDFTQAVDNTAQLAAFLLKRYHLDLDDVRQHGDFTNKNCPEHLRQDDQYAQFLDKIKLYLKTQEEL